VSSISCISFNLSSGDNIDFPIGAGFIGINLVPSKTHLSSHARRIAYQRSNTLSEAKMILIISFMDFIPNTTNKKPSNTCNELKTLVSHHKLCIKNKNWQVKILFMYLEIISMAIIYQFGYWTAKLYPNLSNMKYIILICCQAHLHVAGLFSVSNNCYIHTDSRCQKRTSLKV
jgi:hypothetical protein